MKTMLLEEESVPANPDLPLILVTTGSQIFFGGLLIVPELDFESLIWPGDPLPPSLHLCLFLN